MQIGAHVSAAGGLYNAPDNAVALGLECFQFFSRPPQGGRVGPITGEAAEKFLEACRRHGLTRWYIHAPYVINLASVQERIRENTIEILRGELERGSLLKTTGMMFHPGSASGTGFEVAMKHVVDGLKRVLDGYQGTTRPLVEISAGAGEVIADTFEEVRMILDGVDDERLGVCFDTAHAFASGYDLRTEAATRDTMELFDRTVGNERLMVSHCNDSKVALGERKDRHEHLGKGYIGKKGFEAIVKTPPFDKLDLILETPVEEVAKDIAFLKRLK